MNSPGEGFHFFFGGGGGSEGNFLSLGAYSSSAIVTTALKEKQVPSRMNIWPDGLARGSTCCVCLDHWNQHTRGRGNQFHQVVLCPPCVHLCTYIKHTQTRTHAHACTHIHYLINIFKSFFLLTLL